MKVELEELKQVRPGRLLYVRKVVLGSPNVQPSLTIVALHGTCASQSHYSPLLDALDESLTKSNSSLVVWLYDNVGCGQSPVLRDWDAYSNENFALDLRAILRDMVLTSNRLPVVLMGHSYSPTILLEMMNRHPLEDFPVSGFIFVSSAIRSDDPRNRLTPDGGHPIMRLPVFILNCLQRKMSEAFLELALYKDCNPDLRNACLGENNRNDMAMARATHRHHKWATSADLGVLDNIPTLILHGTEDGIIIPQCSEVLNKEVANSKLVLIAKASHLLMLEQPQEMAASIVGFLKENTLLEHA